MKTTLYKVACSIILICVMPFISLSQEKRSETASAVSTKETVSLEALKSNEPVKIEASAAVKADRRSATNAETQNPQDAQIPIMSGKNLTMYQIKYDSFGHATVTLPTVGKHEIHQVIAVSGKWIKVNFMGVPDTYQGWINTDDTNWLYVQW